MKFFSESNIDEQNYKPNISLRCYQCVYGLQTDIFETLIQLIYNHFSTVFNFNNSFFVFR
jgi:hypothetical protein